MMNHKVIYLVEGEYVEVFLSKIRDHEAEFTEEPNVVIMLSDLQRILAENETKPLLERSLDVCKGEVDEYFTCRIENEANIVDVTKGKVYGKVDINLIIYDPIQSTDYLHQYLECCKRVKRAFKDDVLVFMTDSAEDWMGVIANGGTLSHFCESSYPLLS